MENKFKAYYNEFGQVIALSVEEDLFESYVDVDEELATDFIMGKQDISNWIVDLDQNKLVPNTIDIRSKDYLHFGKVNEITTQLENGVTVTIFNGSNTIEFSIPEKYVGMELSNIGDIEVSFKLTKYGDPTQLLGEYSFRTSELMDYGSLRYQFTEKQKRYELFTETVFREYGLIISDESWIGNAQNNVGKLKRFVQVGEFKKISDDYIGVVFTHDTSDNTLTIETKGEVTLATPPSDLPSLFATKKNDNTLHLQSFQYDINELVKNKKIVLKVNKKTGITFDLSGYPLSDYMAFIRK